MKSMKRALARFLSLALILSLLLVPAGAAELTEYAPAGSMTELYAAVSGGAAAPAEGAYSIGSAEELKLLADFVAAGNGGAGLTFYLTGDVDLGGEASPWAPIGVFDTQYENHLPFAGTFDGCGHAVTGLYVGGDDYARGDGVRSEANVLFGLNAGTIRNLASRMPRMIPRSTAVPPKIR